MLRPHRPWNQRLFRRLSQITGVPVASLKPAIEQQKPPSGSLGIYHSKTHSIAVSWPGRKKWREHEERHGLQHLLEKPFFRRTITFKPTHATPKKWGHQEKRYVKNFLEPTNPVRSPLLTAFALSDASLLPFKQFIRNLKRTKLFRALVQRHGEDAALLLWADPPVTPKRIPFSEKIPDALFIPEWEQKMTEWGFLKERGGFTKRGLRYFREKIQAALLWRRIAIAERERPNRAVPAEHKNWKKWKR